MGTTQRNAVLAQITAMFTGIMAKYQESNRREAAVLNHVSPARYYGHGAQYGRGPRRKNRAHCARKAKTLKRRAA